MWALEGKVSSTHSLSFTHVLCKHKRQVVEQKLVWGGHRGRVIGCPLVSSVLPSTTSQLPEGSWSQRAPRGETPAVAMSGILGFLLVPNSSRWTETQACWSPEVFFILSPQCSFFLIHGERASALLLCLPSGLGNSLSFTCKWFEPGRLPMEELWLLWVRLTQTCHIGLKTQCLVTWLLTNSKRREWIT